MSKETFIPKLIQILASALVSQDQGFELVASKMASTIESGGLVHLFGSGHSVIPTLDAFPRYGSFVGLHPMNDPRLMWHNVLGPGGVQELLWLERTEGYIAKFLANEPIANDDVLIVFSHGGRNAAPVEAATYGRDHGAWVVGVTSLANTQRPPQHSSGKRLADVCDATLDTGVPIEDALVEVKGWSRPLSGASTIVATTFMQELVARTAQHLAQNGVSMPTFVSPTVPGASVASNDEVFEEHRARLLAAFGR